MLANFVTRLCCRLVGHKLTDNQFMCLRCKRLWYQDSRIFEALVTRGPRLLAAMAIDFHNEQVRLYRQFKQEGSAPLDHTDLNQLN